MAIRAFQAAIFLSAFLLFLLQPVASKALLPVFGGSYLVWGTCMVFFQGSLLAGYAYAHFVQSRLGAVRYSRWHWSVLLAGFAVFPTRFGRLDAIAPGSNPWIDVVLALALLIGPPFFALSTMSVVIQRWLSVSSLPESANPYALYSPSNLGSMAALLGYPTIIEPLLNLKQQANLFWAGFGVLFVLQFFCLPRGRDIAGRDDTPGGESPKRSELFRWFLPSAAGAAMLLAVTNVITFDIASVPFLWIIPLSAYLLTFVLVFKRRAWFPVWVGNGLNWAVALAVLIYYMKGMRLEIPAPAALGLQVAILFIVCMNCHGILVKRKPADPAHLTLFYMILSLGGFCGSLFVTWIVPMVSHSAVEYLIALALAVGAVGVCGSAPVRSGLPSSAVSAVVLAISMVAAPAILGGRLHMPPHWVMIAALVPTVLVIQFVKDRPLHLAVILVVALGASLGTESRMFGTTDVLRLRNFYGIYKVYDRDGIRYLKHGTTLHGREYLDPEKAGTPLSYHHPTAPAGELLRSGLIRPTSAGMIGLGTGAMSMYFREGQELTIYELDPDNIPIAQKQFFYLGLAKANGAKHRLVVGDGRLSLRKAPAGAFDLLVVDAFSSGSIPVHLLTREAFSEYMRVLRPAGLLLLHITNRTLDLRYVVFSVARSLGLEAAAKSNKGKVDADAEMSLWLAVSRNPEVMHALKATLGWQDEGEYQRVLPKPWTDRYSNLFGLLFRIERSR